MRRSIPHLAVLAAALVAVAGCGIDEDVVAREAGRRSGGPSTTTSTEAAEPGEPTASPFTVDAVPAGYEEVVEGTGEVPVDDAVPVTVLAPDGVPEGAGVVFVEVAPDDAEPGFTAATDDSPWAALVDGPLRVWGVEADEDALQEVADAAAVPDRPGAAPVVDDPPADLAVVGSIAADGVAALAAGVPSDDDGAVPGPASAHVAVWACEDCDGSLVAMALPAGALDPEAVVTEVREPRRTSPDPRDAVEERFEAPNLDGGPGLDGRIVTTADPGTGAVVRRILAVEMPWGDVLLLVSRGADGPDEVDLEEIARSVGKADR